MPGQVSPAWCCASASRAAHSQLPQQVLTSSFSCSASKLRQPPATALAMSRSEMFWQTQMITTRILMRIVLVCNI